MSFTKGVSFHHETNAASQPTINNNISINASSEIKNNESSEKVEVRVEKPLDVQTQASIPNETEFLRKVLAIYMDQRFTGKTKL